MAVSSNSGENVTGTLMPKRTGESPPPVHRTALPNTCCICTSSDTLDTGCIRSSIVPFTAVLSVERVHADRLPAIVGEFNAVCVVRTGRAVGGQINLCRCTVLNQFGNPRRST